MKKEHRDMIADAMQLHQEFPNETTFFVEFINATVRAIKKNLNYHRDNWVRKENIFDFDIWIGFIDTIEERIRNNKGDIIKKPEVFAQLLFGDGNRMFTLHCLYSLAQAIPENDRFNNKVVELFS
jgi:hypothetical protein